VGRLNVCRVSVVCGCGRIWLVAQFPAPLGDKLTSLEKDWKSWHRTTKPTRSSPVSHRLGADPRNTNYAGGNTSAKGTDTDPVTGVVSIDVGEGIRPVTLGP